MECEEVPRPLSAQKTKQKRTLRARETRVGNTKHPSHHVTEPRVRGQRSRERTGASGTRRGKPDWRLSDSLPAALGLFSPGLDQLLHDLQGHTLNAHPRTLRNAGGQTAKCPWGPTACKGTATAPSAPARCSAVRLRHASRVPGGGLFPLLDQRNVSEVTSLTSEQSPRSHSCWPAEDDAWTETPAGPGPRPPQQTPQAARW